MKLIQILFLFVIFILLSPFYDFYFLNSKNFTRSCTHNENRNIIQCNYIDDTISTLNPCNTSKYSTKHHVKLKYHKINNKFVYIRFRNEFLKIYHYVNYSQNNSILLTLEIKKIAENVKKVYKAYDKFFRARIMLNEIFNFKLDNVVLKNRTLNDNINKLNNLFCIAQNLNIYVIPSLLIFEVDGEQFLALDLIKGPVGNKNKSDDVRDEVFVDSVDNDLFVHLK